jgi:protein-disulfide isomerase
MSTDQKIIGGVALVSIVILGWAVVMFSGNSQTSSSQIADPALLVRSDSNQIATDSAKVTIVEFGDYQCPACAMAAPVAKQLIDEYPGQVNFVFRHFPLPQHANAMIAAKAAEAAGEQGRYWQMHDLLYANQAKWERVANPLEIFVGYAKELGLNESQFREVVGSNKYFDKINGDKNDGEALGVNSTPTFFINGVKTSGFSAPTLKQQIEKALQ